MGGWGRNPSAQGGDGGRNPSAQGGVGGRIPPPPVGGPPPFGKGGWRRTGPRLRKRPLRRPGGGWRRTGARLRKAPLAKGGWRRTGLRAMNKGAFAVPKGSGAGRRPAEGGFIRPPNLAFPPGGFVLRLRRSWGQNPSTGCAGPPPFSKGGLWRTGPRHRQAPAGTAEWPLI